MFVTDITPPEVSGSLDFARGGSTTAWFQVSYQCSDASGVSVAATINGVPVENGEVVRLTLLRPGDLGPSPRWHRNAVGQLRMWDYAFELTVHCEDGAGNTATAVASPAFPERGRSGRPR